MDALSLAALSLIGIAAGWWLRALNEPKEAPLPCTCHCNCVQQGESSTGSNWGYTGVYLILVILICLALAVGSFAAVALKVSYTSKGSDQELAISVKGRSKGIINPPRSLQITS